MYVILGTQKFEVRLNMLGLYSLQKRGMKGEMMKYPFAEKETISMV